MLYLLTLVVLSTVPLYLAFRSAKAHPARHTGIGVKSVFWTVLGGGGWFAITWVSRNYAETDLPLWAVAEWFAHRGCWYVFGAVAMYFIGVAICRQHALGRRRQVWLGLCVEVMLLWLVVWRTVPIFIFLNNEVTRGERGFIRQSIEYTCAPVSLGNLLEMEGNIQISERFLSRISGTTVEGTTMSGILRAGRSQGLEVSLCRSLMFEELESLGAPAFVQISTLPSVRHAVLFVGMDKTHVQFVDPAYGLHEVTRRRFAEIWYGKTIMFKHAKQPGKYAGHRTTGHLRRQSI
jgi:predicted double-glycine peptidase